jgi:hypothetical protein
LIDATSTLPVLNVMIIAGQCNAATGPWSSVMVLATGSTALTTPVADAGGTASGATDDDVAGLDSGIDAIAAPAVEAVAGGVLAAVVSGVAELTDSFGAEQDARKTSVNNKLGIFISMSFGLVS